MSDQITNAVETAPVTGDTPVKETPVQLQLTDIAAAAQCIQLAAQRGAFRAEEFTQVGGCYERIVAFLTASGALTPPTGETAKSAE